MHEIFTEKTLEIVLAHEISRAFGFFVPSSLVKVSKKELVL